MAFSGEGEMGPYAAIARQGDTRSGLGIAGSRHHDDVADVIAGIFLALVAYAVFLRNYSRANIPELHRRLAPVLALCVSGIVALGIACFWVAYQLRAWV